MSRRLWLLFVIAPLGVMAGFFGAIVLLYLQPKTYESTATVELRPEHSILLPGEEAVKSMSPTVFRDQQMKVMRGSKVALMAAIQGDFAKRWGVSEEEAARRIQSMVTVNVVRGTDLIAVRAVSNDRLESRDLAMAVVGAYSTVYIEKTNAESDEKLAALSRMVKEQEAKVEEKRKKLSDLVRNHDLLQRDKELPAAADGIGEEKMEYEADLSQLQANKMKHVTETATWAMAADMASVHEDANVPLEPAGPDVMQYLKVGPLVGGAAGVLLGLLGMLLFPARKQGLN